MSHPSYDVIVVGGGVIGLSTAYYLSKHKYKVLVLEQFPIPHTRGSSHGHSRLSKVSHLKDYMVEFLPTAHRLWITLQEDSKIPLFVNTGHLTIFKSQQQKLLNVKRNALIERNVAFTDHRGNEIGKAFPGLNFGENFNAIFEPNGIVLKADKCLQALQNEVIGYGGLIHESEEVLAVTPLGDKSARVRSNKETYYTKAVVLACGPWIKKMMEKLDTPIAAQAVRVTAYFWKERRKGLYSVKSKFPPLMLHFSSYHLYSTPSMEYDGLIKICYHHRAPVNPDLPEIVAKEDLKKEEERFCILKKLISEHFPHLHPDPVLKESYLQTVTPDLNLITDKHPLHQNIIIGGGCSGYGFGVAPAIGEVLGKLATFQPSTYSFESLLLKNNLRTSKI